MKKSIFTRCVLIGALSCIFGSAALFATFYFLIRGAERWSGNRLLNDTPLGMFQQNPSVATAAIAGVAFAWFAFGFFITYSRLSSKAELSEDGRH